MYGYLINLINYPYSMVALYIIVLPYYMVHTSAAILNAI